MPVCPRCNRTVPTSKYCDQCGHNLTDEVVFPPRLLQSPVYLCGKCGERLPNHQDARFCINCGSAFRAMPRCPDGHPIIDFNAKYCSQCGLSVTPSHRSTSPIPDAKFQILEPQPYKTRTPPPQLSSPTCACNESHSPLREVARKLNHAFHKPKVRIIRGTEAQQRVAMQQLSGMYPPQISAPQGVPPWMNGQMQGQMRPSPYPPYGFRPQMGWPPQGRGPIVYPRGYPPQNNGGYYGR